MHSSQQHFFGGGGHTDIQPLSLLLVLISCIAILMLPRRYACAALLITCTILPLDQQAVIAGIHITMSRVLLCCGWTRLLISTIQGNIRVPGLWNKLDLWFVAYCICNSVTYVALWWGDSGALINRLGFLFNACGTYFLMRFFLADLDDIQRTTRVLVWTCVVIGSVMIWEQRSGHNPFSVLGGVPDLSVIRDGKIRAQGPFVHPLTAGALGATLMPLAFGLWWTEKKHALISIGGIAASLSMALSARSSTAVLAIAAAVFALLMWHYKQHLRRLRWLTLATLITLHLLMKAPVWALIARIDLTGSSSGYQRYELVDQFIRHFSDWWCVGIRDTAPWGWDMWDTINAYVAAGTNGGVLSFTIFIGLLTIGFQQVGVRRALVGKDCALSRELWVLGALLFAHAVALFGIVYFDQSQFIWYSELAMIGSCISLVGEPVDAETRTVITPDPSWVPWDISRETSEVVVRPLTSPVARSAAAVCSLVIRTL